MVHPKYWYFLSQIIPLFACDLNKSWQRGNHGKSITQCEAKWSRKPYLMFHKNFDAPLDVVYRTMRDCVEAVRYGIKFGAKWVSKRELLDLVRGTKIRHFACSWPREALRDDLATISTVTRSLLGDVGENQPLKRTPKRPNSREQISHTPHFSNCRTRGRWDPNLDGHRA